MNYQNKKLVLFFISFLLIYQNAYAQTPLDKVKEKVDAIISVVTEAKKNETLSNQATEDKLWAIVDSIFDFSILSQKALGRKWLSMNNEEQTKFISSFRKLLGQSYLNKIKSYENEETLYLKEVFPNPKYVEVSTKIVSKEQQYALNYRLINLKDDWKIYDVSIEGVSLLSNYRSQFNEFLQKNTIQALLDNLKKKAEAHE
jgi:phospholipid transport system substrate-binding protein